MHPTLASDLEKLDKILTKTQAISHEHLSRQEALPPGRLVPAIGKATLPDEGIGAIAVLEYFHQHYADSMSNSAGPSYFGFVTGGSTPASVAGDWLVSAFDQNACGSNDSVAPQIEHQTIGFFRELFGLDEQFFGTFVTGATMSNFTSLAIARQWIGEQRGVDFGQDGLSSQAPIRILSGTPHSSILKSLSMSGMGRNALVKIDTQNDREAVDIAKLEHALRSYDGPTIVIANAGTVNTVDFDDLEAIGALKTRYNFWLHVDAAFGGFAACSDQFSHLMKGINHADSVTVDAHKWLNVPYDAAMQFTRHKNLQLKVFQNSAAYLGDPESSPDLFHYTPENSRRFRGLPSWFTLMAYGRNGYQEIVERNCDCARVLGSHLERSNDFRLLAPVRMNVVCFAFRNQVDFGGIQAFLNEVRDDGRVFFTPTVYKGIPAVRAAVSNWRTTRSNMEIAFEVLTRIAAKYSRPEKVPTRTKC